MGGAQELHSRRFLKFHELDFGWASRLVHYILSYQLDCKKKYELWSLVGVRPARFSLHEFEEITGLNCKYVKNLENPLVEVTDEMRAFWGKMGVHFDRGPSIEELTTACQMCETWSRNDRLRLGYLAIYAGFIQAPRSSSPTCASLARLVMDQEAFKAYPWGKVAFKFLMDSVKGLDLAKPSYAMEGFVQVLQVWIYWCLPEFAAGFGDPIEGTPTPPLLAYSGNRGKRYLKENIVKQTRVNNFALKELSEMFLLWDGDREDQKADNIVKAMFNRHWVWEESHWPLIGTKLWTNVKEEIHPMKTDAGQMEQSKVALSPSPTESEGVSSKKARQSHGLDVETMKAEIAQWPTGLTSTMVEELSTMKNTLKTQSDRLEGLTAKMGHLEKIVQEGWKEDYRKAGSSADVFNGDKDKEDIGEESRAEEAPPKPARMTTRAKAKDTVLKKVRDACIVARARSDRQRRLAATQKSPFAGNSTAKVIIPNQPYRGLGYNPFAGVDKPKLSVLIDWLQLDP
ncbi:Ulp1 protease family protein [Raphanus sativus]|nr:Ulp1 protease family protein [Raphanus sativus]